MRSRAVASGLVLVGIALVLYATFALTWWRYDGPRERARGGLVTIRSCQVAVEAAPDRCETWSAFDAPPKTAHVVLGIVTFGANLLAVALALVALAFMWRGRARYVRRGLPRIAAALAAIASIAFVITGELTPLWMSPPLHWIGCLLVLLGDALAADAAND